MRRARGLLRAGIAVATKTAVTSASAAGKILPGAVEVSLARSTTQCADRLESLDFLRPNGYI